MTFLKYLTNAQTLSRTKTWMQQPCLSSLGRTVSKKTSTAEYSSTCVKFLEWSGGAQRGDNNDPPVTRPLVNSLQRFYCSWCRILRWTESIFPVGTEMIEDWLAHVRLLVRFPAVPNDVVSLGKALHPILASGRMSLYCDKWGLSAQLKQLSADWRTWGWYEERVYKEHEEGREGKDIDIYIKAFIYIYGQDCVGQSMGVSLFWAEAWNWPKKLN